MAKTKKRKALTDEEIVSILRERVEEVVDFNDSQLARDRAEALRFYFGKPFGNELVGRSQVISRDEQEVVDWIMPSLMKTFSGSDTVVQISPRKAEDSEWAEVATEVMNYLYNIQNDGFLITYQWIQDALLCKNGIVKVYIEEYPEKQYEYYSSMSQEDIDFLVENTEGVTVLLQTPDPASPGKFKLQVELEKVCRKFKVVNVPPEEFLIDRDARSIDDAQLAVHRVKKTVSELRAMGVPEEIIKELPYEEYTFIEGSPERIVRDEYDGRGDFAYHDDELNHEANKTVWIAECYPKLDVDNDGYAELRRIVICGEHILFNEMIEERPFAYITPYIIAHKFFGMSIHDKLKDIQLVRSTLLRHIMDNVYANTNGRYEVVEGMADLDELRNSVAGGYVTVKAAGSINPLTTPQLSSDVYNMLEYWEKVRDQRSGVSDQTRGMDGNFLHSNQAATSVNQMMSAAEQQVELIARVIAEVGFKTLFRKLYNLVVRHQDEEMLFSMKGKYIKANPTSWREDIDVVVTVGLGNGNKDQQLMHLNSMLQMTQMVIQQGGMGILTNYDKVYNLLCELSKNAGFKDANRFWLDPKTPEAQQALQALQEAESKPQPEDIKAQADAMAKQAEAQSKQAQQQLEAQKIAAEMEIRKRELALKEREASLKEAELQLDRDRFDWERARDNAEYELEEKQARSVAIGDGKVRKGRK